MTKIAKYRDRLPQRSQQIFLTDGGMETTLVYHDGLDLPCFASFTLLRTPEGIARTRAYYTRYAAMAQKRRTRLRAGDADLAGQCRLGREAWLFECRIGRRQ